LGNSSVDNIITDNDITLAATGISVGAGSNNNILFPNKIRGATTVFVDSGSGNQFGLIASGSTALGTSAIGANACASAVTVSAPGVATTDRIVASPSADLSAVTGYGTGNTDGLLIYPYPTANNVNFKVCNTTGSSITPGAATLNWSVTR